MRQSFTFSLLFLLFGWFGRAFADTPGAVRFVQNKGQWSPDVLYRAELPGGFLFLKKKSLHYLFYDSESLDRLHSGPSSQPAARTAPPPTRSEPMVRAHGVDVQLQNSQPTARIESKNRVSDNINYFLGNESSRWASAVPAFGEVIYHDIYPGINLRLFAYYQTLKYEFIVRPGADPSVIRLHYNGATAVRQENGQLIIQTSLLPFREEKPYSFTEKNGKTTEVASQWLLDGQTAAFGFPSGYDSQQPLTIDPTLIFSTYSGSVSDNWGHTATYDNEGNLYTAGTVFGNSFVPTTGAFQTRYGAEIDIAIMKFSPDGKQLLYAAYLGGSTGETPHSLIVNSKNELLIYGVTSSTNFPTTASAYNRKFAGGSSYIPIGNQTPDPSSLYGSIYFRNGTDLFLAKISPDGRALQGSTYVGGSSNDGLNYADLHLGIYNYGDDLRGEVILDKNDNVYVATVTMSADFPVTANASQSKLLGPADAVLLQMSPDLSQLRWSTFFGGSGYDVSYALRVGDSGAVYAVGTTLSNDLPGTTGAHQSQPGGQEDGFLVKFVNNRVERSTYLGTSADDAAYLIDLDAQENPHVFGLTRGQYPVSDSVYQNARSGQFIHALDPSLSKTLFSTVIGSGRSSPDISPTAFLVNECGNIYLSGWGGVVNVRSGNGSSSTRGLPVTPEAHRRTTDGSNYWLALLERGGKSLLYATFFGSQNPQGRGDHVDGGTSRFDKSGVIYHAACACGGTNFPATAQVWSPTNKSPNCNNAAFKFDIDRLKAAFDAYEGTKKDVVEGCTPLTLNFVNTSEGGITYAWDFGGTGTSSSAGQVSHTFDKPGEYTVTLSAFNKLTCKQVDVAQKIIKVYPANFKVSSDTTICPGKPVQLLADGGKTYEWSPAQGMASATVNNPTVQPTQTTTYTVKMTNESGCSAEKKVTIKTDDAFRPVAEVRLNSECGQPMKVELVNKTAGADNYQWAMGNGDTLRANTPGSYQYANSGQYQISLTTYKNGCSLTLNLPVDIENMSEVPNVVTSNDDGKNDVFNVGFTGAKLEIFNRWGKLIYRSDNYSNNWGPDAPNGLYYYLITTQRGTKCKGWVQVLE
ncbi:gliding motility-associated C-terminal domain-containing protein [Larkinella insperata]|uniref:Gliding motility-associated C-terminal domain-containing protein n=1 Tax=Larkinella insperata TaxID=332158 RepID=A0ABW3Q9H8_9BACT|nr:gliding motility-associated C-terminal domain-containing protein [Larkinella insperata]